MTITNIINNINKLFPNINAVHKSEFDGSDENAKAIWFRMEGEEHGGVRYFNPYGTPEFHPKLVKSLAEVGMHLEPHDSGTLMAYEG
jgi:hypothetical protein